MAINDYLTAEQIEQYRNATKALQEVYQTAPGFTTPYKNPKEFAKHLATSLIVAPAALTLITAAAATLTALAPIAAIAALCTAGVTAVTGSKETVTAALGLAVLAATATVAAAIATVLFAAITALAIAVTPVYLLSRGASTAYAAFFKTPAPAPDAQDNNVLASDLAPAI